MATPSINDDIRAIEQALHVLEPRIDIAHPALNAAIHDAFVTLDRARWDLMERLDEAVINAG